MHHSLHAIKASRIIAEFSHDEILRMFYHTTVRKVNKCCNLSFQNTIDKLKKNL